jgi:multiple sugar transport system substrate-binding protein
MDKAYPFKNEILAQIKNGANRPQTPAYQNVSTVISARLSPPAAINPQQTADQLRGEIQDALESKGVLP